MCKYAFDKYLGNVMFPEYDTVIYNTVKNNGIWEPKEFFWLFDNVKEGQTCINVGANIGYFSTVMSKLVKETGKVYAIEANPQFENYIKHNAKLSEFDNIEIIMSAAGDFLGHIDLFISSDNSGDNRVFDPNIIKNQFEQEVVNVKNKIKVKINTVDNLVVDKKVDIILIDCQGWDHYIIRGMKNIIKNSKPKILTEFVPKWINELKENPLNILQEYENLGYNLLCPDLDIFIPSSPEVIIDEMLKKQHWFTNIYLEPK